MTHDNGMSGAVLTLFGIVLDGPPLAVMTCLGCKAADVNEDWAVVTASRFSVTGKDIGICPACMYEVFGARAFTDKSLRRKAREASVAREPLDDSRRLAVFTGLRMKMVSGW